MARHPKGASRAEQHLMRMADGTGQSPASPSHHILPLPAMPRPLPSATVEIVS